MAGFSIAPDEVVQTTLRGTLYGQQTRNILYHRYRDTNPTPASVEVSVLNDAIVASLLPDLAAAQSAEFAFYQIDYRLLNATFPFVLSFPVASPGLSGAQSLPPSVTVNTKRQVDLIGRINRQRNYWAGIPETDHSEGVLTAAAILVWQVVATRLVTDLATPVVGQIFENVLTGIAVGGGPTTIRDLIVGLVDPVLRSQRRREVGVGI